MSNSRPLALQLYTVRDMLDHDFEGTVRRVADIGYAGVEPYGGMTSKLNEAAELFTELQLEVFNSHIPFPDDANKDAVLAIAQAFGLKRVVIAFLPPAEFETIDAIQRSCESLNRASQFAQANGLQLGYHNHWWEFKELNGKSTLDLMLSELDDEVFFEIDTYWVQVGGIDAAEVLSAVGARAPLVHLKDGSLDKDDAQVAVGSGKMAMPEVVAASADTADWYVVELDHCDGDMLQAVQDSYAYLTRNGLAQGRV